MFLFCDSFWCRIFFFTSVCSSHNFLLIYLCIYLYTLIHVSVFKDPNNIKLPQRLFQIISVFSNVFVVQFPNVDIRGLREVTLEQGPITSSSVAKICGQKRGKSSSGKKEESKSSQMHYNSFPEIQSAGRKHALNKMVLSLKSWRPVKVRYSALDHRKFHISDFQKSCIEQKPRLIQK